MGRILLRQAERERRGRADPGAVVAPRGRPPGSKNKKAKAENDSADTKALRRKRRQRKLEAAVKLHEFLAAEADAARAADPNNPLLYQNTQAKILGKPFERTAARLKRRR